MRTRVVLGVGVVAGLLAGLGVSQQLANEPDSDRWLRLLDDAVDMLIHHVSSAPGHAPALGRLRHDPAGA